MACFRIRCFPWRSSQYGIPRLVLKNSVAIPFRSSRPQCDGKRGILVPFGALDFIDADSVDLADATR
jgi:hypothetical protein